MRICVVSPSFPTPKTIDFVFVDQLCRAFADLGHEVVVIAPQSVTKCLFRHIPLMPQHSWYQTAQGNSIELYRPYSVSLSDSKLSKFFKNSHKHAVKRAFRRIKQKPDVCYGHFWGSIFSVYPMAKQNGIPLFGASGEESVAYYVHQAPETINELRNYVSGVVSVSTKNRDECLDLHLIDEEKSVVIPNAIDQSLFHKLDKTECRRELNITDNDFVVAFVGQFVPRKGTLRLNEALKKLGNRQIKAVFIGSGNEDPDYDGIIYKGRVAHDDVPKWLNAADVFVLPTENEGCCNAIIEAMACGLPIISTDASFNYDILNKGNSIMVDCHDIGAIANAIKTMKNNPKRREEMSLNALKTAEGLKIDKRAEKIIEFINKSKQQ